MPKQKTKAKSTAKKEKNDSLARSIRKASVGTKYETTRSEGTRRFPIFLVLGFAVLTAILMSIIFSFMQISQIQADIAEMRSTIRSLENEERKISRELEGEYSSQIESLAEDIGLSGGNRVTYYISKDAPTEVREVIDPDEENGSSNTLMSAVSRSLKRFIEFLE